MVLIGLLFTVFTVSIYAAYYSVAGRRSDGELIEDPPRSAPAGVYHGWRDPWTPERRRSRHGAVTGTNLLRKTNTWGPGAVVIIGQWQQGYGRGGGRDEGSIAAGPRTGFETGDGDVPEEVVLELGITEDSLALRTHDGTTAAVGHGGGQEATPQPAPSDAGIQSENVLELACIGDSIALRIHERTNTVYHGGGRGVVPEFASSSRGIRAGSEMNPSSRSVISSERHGSPTAPLFQRPTEDLSLYERNLNSHNGTTGQGGGVPQITRSDTIVAMQEPRTTRDDAEAVKHGVKVAYCTIATATAGIVTIIYGFFQGQVTQAYRLHLKICVIFLLISFVSAVILILLAAPHESTIDRTQTVTVLMYTTMGALVLAIVDVSFVFLKLVVLIVEVPILLLLLLMIFVLRLRSRTTIS